MLAALLTQTLCITAFAENPVEVLIPQGSETNAILTAALIPDATETKSWEYKCEGTSKIFTKNTAWGSVNGFESSTKKLGITTTYTHAALAANTDGQYQVRVAGTTKEYTIEKKAKLTSGIELNTGVSVALVYGEDGTLDAAATEDAIVRAKSVKPADAALTVEYYASATSGSLGSAGKDWMPIAGGKSGLLTYPAISEGEQQIRLTYAGNKNYAKTEIVVTVDVKSRDPLTFDLNKGPYEVPLVFTAEQGYDYDETAKKIYDTVVKGTSPIDVDFSEVTVEYDASLTSGTIKANYQPLDNSAFGTNKFGEGTWNIRFRWPGSREVAPGEVVVSVTMTDSRLASSVVLKDGASFTYNKDVAVMKQAILDSVIDWENSNLPSRDSLSVDDFTFTY